MDLVYGVCLKYFKESEDAKDSVLDIFEELVIKLRKYDVINFKSWLYQLTKNHCLVVLRQQRKIPVTIDITTVQLPNNMHLDHDSEKEKTIVLMEKCITQLPNHQKQAIELFYMQDKCYKEIAELTGLQLGEVRSFIQNGRRNLKICMKKNSLEQTTV